MIAKKPETAPRARLSIHEWNQVLAMREKPNVLIIGDTHLPYELPGYLQFCLDTAERFQCGTVLHIGDFFDSHAVSRHGPEMDADGAREEFDKAIAHAQAWYEAFPTLTMTIGNHDMRPFKAGLRAGLPSRWLKGIAEALEMPGGWTLVDEIELGDVLFRHQGGSGQQPALTYAKRAGVNTVCGHVHSASGVHFQHQRDRVLWGLDTGCGADRSQICFRYAGQSPAMHAHGCGVIWGGLPVFVPMNGGAT